MNKSNKYNFRRFGKFVRRVIGEESGHAKLKCIIIATAIAAAMVLSAWIFGSQIRRAFMTIPSGPGGNHTQSAQITQMAQDLTVIKAAIATQNGGSKFTDSCPAKTVEQTGNGGDSK